MAKDKQSPWASGYQPLDHSSSDGFYDQTEADNLQIQSLLRRTMLKKTIPDEALNPIAQGPINSTFHPEAPSLSTTMDEFSYIHIESQTQDIDDEQASEKGEDISQRDVTDDEQPDRARDEPESKTARVQEEGVSSVGISGRKPAGRKGAAKPSTYTEEDEAVITEGYLAGATHEEIAAELGRLTQQGIEHKIRRMIAEGKLPESQPK